MWLFSTFSVNVLCPGLNNRCIRKMQKSEQTIFIITGNCILSMYTGFVGGMIKQILGKQVKANSVGPDQTPQKSGAWSEPTLFAIHLVVFRHVSRQCNGLVQDLGQICCPNIKFQFLRCPAIPTKILITDATFCTFCTFHRTA